MVKQERIAGALIRISASIIIVFDQEGVRMEKIIIKKEDDDARGV